MTTALLQAHVSTISFGSFRAIVVLLVVVVDHAAIRQRQIGQKMMCANDAPDGKIGDRRVDMRDQVQAPWSDPGAFYVDVGQVDCNQLADLSAAVDTGD